MIDQRRRFDMPALEEQGGAPPGGRQDRAAPGGPDRRSVSEVLRYSADASSPRRTSPTNRAAGPGRDQSRAGGPHRSAARSRRAADAGRARPARQVPGQGARRRLRDQGPGGRRFRPHAKAAWAASSPTSPISRSSSRATGSRRSSSLECLQARRHHARHPHAGDGRPGLPRPDHGRASLSGRDGVVTDCGGRGRDARGVASGRGRFRPQARRRDLAAHRRVAGQLVAKVRAAAGARIKSSARLRERVQHRIGARRHGVARPPRTRPRRMRRPGAAGEGLVLVGTSTGGPPALEALLRRCRPTFRGPSSSRSTCPRVSPGALARRLDGLCALASWRSSRTVQLEPGRAYIGTRRRRRRRRAPAVRPGRDAGPARSRLSLASERRPAG